MTKRVMEEETAKAIVDLTVESGGGLTSDNELSTQPLAEQNWIDLADEEVYVTGHMRKKPRGKGKENVPPKVEIMDQTSYQADHPLLVLHMQLSNMGYEVKYVPGTRRYPEHLNVSMT